MAGQAGKTPAGRGVSGGALMAYLSLGVVALLVLPVLIILGSLLRPAPAVWSHLLETVLGRYVTNSLLLGLGVGMGTVLIGVSTAWLVTACRFPGSRWLTWGLVLPFAAPAYILAYAYTDLLEAYNPIQLTVRAWLGLPPGVGFWQVRSLPGAIAMLTLALYPYVYLLARVAFLEQSGAILEAGRSLGCGPWRGFGRLALPLARPAVTAGVALALMEALADFGTVQYFGVDTFTTGIYRTWYGLGERQAATQLAACLLLAVLGLLLLERWSRRQIETRVAAQPPASPYRLQGWRAMGAGLVCFLPIALGFVIPAAALLHLTLEQGWTAWDDRFWSYARHSAILGGLSAGLAVGLALLLAYQERLRPDVWVQGLNQLAGMGYAVPGSVVAVGVLIPLGRFDNWLDSWMLTHLGWGTGLLLSGTLVALVFAYLVRFMAPALGTVTSGLGKIQPSLDDAARSLGSGPAATLIQVHLPLLTNSLITAAMVVFVDVVKELPATLIIRPFNFDTLAVRVYTLAADERLAEAAAPSLAIVLVSMIPVIVLQRALNGRRPAAAQGVQDAWVP